MATLLKCRDDNDPLPVVAAQKGSNLNWFWATIGCWLLWVLYELAIMKIQLGNPLVINCCIILRMCSRSTPATCHVRQQCRIHPTPQTFNLRTVKIPAIYGISLGETSLQNLQSKAFPVVTPTDFWLAASRESLNRPSFWDVLRIWIRSWYTSKTQKS